MHIAEDGLTEAILACHQLQQLQQSTHAAAAGGGAAPLTCVEYHISLSCLQLCSDTAQLTCANPHFNLTYSQY